MASSPIRHEFAARDGIALVRHELWPVGGGGRPVILVHGLFSNAHTNWIRYGHAAEIAGRGFRVIMPDLRAHGESAKPHDPARYPPDILADDLLALIDDLDLRDYDLVGYSLGARTCIRALVKGARPRRLIVAGMGLEGVTDTGGRADHFERILSNPGSFERGSPEWLAEAFLKTTKGDPKALLPLLGSFVDTKENVLKTLEAESLVLSGVDDTDNGSGEKLASLIPGARYAEVPGNHMSAVTMKEFGKAIADFLAG